MASHGIHRRIKKRTQASFWPSKISHPGIGTASKDRFAEALTTAAEPAAAPLQLPDPLLGGQAPSPGFHAGQSCRCSALAPRFRLQWTSCRQPLSSGPDAGLIPAWLSDGVGWGQALHLKSVMPSAGLLWPGAAGQPQRQGLPERNGGTHQLIMIDDKAQTKSLLTQLNHKQIAKCPRPTAVSS